MIILFSPRDSVGATIEYCAGEEGDPREPFVVFGDPNDLLMARGLVGEETFQMLTCAPILGFAGLREDPLYLRTTIRSLNEAMIPGMSDQFIAATWRHSESCPDGSMRTAAHELIFGYHLDTGRHFQPYVHRRDAHRMRLWQRHTNRSEGMRDPDDDDVRNAIAAPPNAFPGTLPHEIRTVGERVLHMVTVGKVANTDDVRDLLEMDYEDVKPFTLRGERPGLCGRRRNSSDGRLRVFRGLLYEPDGIERYLSISKPPAPVGSIEWQAEVSLLRTKLDREICRHHARLAEMFPGCVQPIHLPDPREKMLTRDLPTPGELLAGQVEARRASPVFSGWCSGEPSLTKLNSTTNEHKRIEQPATRADASCSPEGADRPSAGVGTGEGLPPPASGMAARLFGPLGRALCRSREDGFRHKLHARNALEGIRGAAIACGRALDECEGAAQALRKALGIALGARSIDDPPAPKNEGPPQLEGGPADSPDLP